MQITQSSQDNVITLQVSGRMDALTCASFEEQALSLPLDDSNKAIILDFKELEYISSAGLRGVLKLAKACKENKKKLACCNLSCNVFEVFKISGFAMILKIVNTKDDALKAVS